jgi:riboflavin synthase
MFTGIIEGLGVIRAITRQDGNSTFLVDCPFRDELKIDQSLAHNGVCLTVTGISGEGYSVTAVSETLRCTNLGALKEGDTVNLERCMVMNGRLDGHIVQGHVDQTGVCTSLSEDAGSWLFTFAYDTSPGHLTVPKGSITVNGVSLTVAGSQRGSFTVAIIPFTYEHTTFHLIREGDKVNLEFDIIGKYVQAYMERK